MAGVVVSEPIPGSSFEAYPHVLNQGAGPFLNPRLSKTGVPRLSKQRGCRSNFILTFVNQAFDNVLMEKACKPKFTKREVHQAAIALGTSSWQARTERFTPEQLSVQLSAAGKLGGRPRKVRI